MFEYINEINGEKNTTNKFRHKSLCAVMTPPTILAMECEKSDCSACATIAGACKLC